MVTRSRDAPASGNPAHRIRTRPRATHGVLFSVRRHQHGMTEIAAKNSRLAACFQRQHQVTGAAGDIQHAGVGIRRGTAQCFGPSGRASSGRYSATADDSAGRSAARCGRTCHAPRRRLVFVWMPGCRPCRTGVHSSVNAARTSACASEERSSDRDASMAFRTVLGYIRGDSHRADPFRQHEMDSALHRFLVASSGARPGGADPCRLEAETGHRN